MSYIYYPENGNVPVSHRRSFGSKGIKGGEQIVKMAGYRNGKKRIFSQPLTFNYSCKT